MEQGYHKESCSQQEQRLLDIHDTEKQVNKKYNVMSLARLAAFLGLAAGIILALAGGFWWGWLLAALMLAGFLIIVKRHEELRLRQQYLKNRYQVEERQYNRLLGAWNTFPETGEEYLTETDYVTRDLDILGQASLYQMLCIAHTTYGKKRLAEALQHGEPDSDARKRRQEAVTELYEKQDFIRGFEALAWDVQEPSYKKNRETEAKKPAETKNAQSGKCLRLIGMLYTGIFLLVILGAGLQWWSSGISLILFFAALAVSWMTSGYCSRIRGDILEREHMIRSYLQMMQAVEQEAFTSPLLIELRQKIAGDGSAMEGAAKLEQLLNAYNMRHNPIIHWLLSGICLYDFHMAAQAATWREHYEDKLQEGIQVLGELEMLGSLAVLGTIRTTTMPEISEQETPELILTGGRHPLLPEEQAVANSIELKGETVIITGSNMSGKTTFLRSIGMNLILANAGAAVCAEAMRAGNMKLFTSMRVSDDVSHGISTFYAEILRIKEMVEYGKTKKPMLCLIDEIFKGTNSADRIVGAEAVIRRLTGEQCLTLVSTHDFELCRLADNYHFEEYYTDGEIHFDYRLKRGKCITTNALQLLKMAGLTENEK